MVATVGVATMHYVASACDSSTSGNLPAPPPDYFKDGGEAGATGKGGSGGKSGTAAGGESGAAHAESGSGGAP
ncbi:MAG TPA: hypothetical protein VM686_10495 [Polyangiaceae bacterium]|nr:hypothetical protein [Polyangiaceae bacterium]